MNKIGITIIAALLAGCSGVLANRAAGDVVHGYTVHQGPGCQVSDLSTESMALITRWWSLNQKRLNGTLTSEEYDEGYVLETVGRCGLLQGDVPVIIVLLDGTVNLARLPDGTLVGFTSGSFIEARFR